MGAQFLAAGVSVSTHFLIVSLVFMAMLLIARLPLLTIENEGEDSGRSVFQLPPRILWPLGAIAFAAAINEGAMLEWSGIYLRDIIHATEINAALGLSAFSFAMTAMRFAGDWLTDKFSAEWIVRGGGLIAASGMGLVLIAPNIIVAFIGIALVGIGVAVTIPLAFSAAGKLPNISPGRGIAGVASIGYAAFLVGPTLIGVISDITSLRFGYLLVLLLAISLWFTGKTLRKA
jgi:MFS family permease